MNSDPELLDAVRKFWENHPLFEGESTHPLGSRKFFEEHRSVYVTDCFAGEVDPRIFPQNLESQKVLDLGCGPGFWTVEFGRRGVRSLVAADITQQALILTRTRCQAYDVSAATVLTNAEKTGFADGTFSHVNCQGVIHHTPDTTSGVEEIARVLMPGGTALLSVYYKNWFLKSWPLLKPIARGFSRFGVGLKGRGRENILESASVEELVRQYDGEGNPLGKVYTEDEFVALLNPFFDVEEVFYHFFPARAVPISIPHPIHRFLDRNAGFMIFARVRKPVL